MTDINRNNEHPDICDSGIDPGFWRRHFKSIRWYGRWTFGAAIDQTGISLHLGPWSFWVVL
jgi:hypothetical protein